MTRKFLLTFCGCFLLLLLRAQQPFKLQYWFDNQYSSCVIVNSDSGKWQTLLDVSVLSEGFHTLNFHIQDMLGEWSVPHAFLFYKTVTLDTVEFNESFTCWFDQDYNHRLNGNIDSGHLLLDVANLSEGFHTVNVQLGSGRSAALQSYLFYKLPVMESVTYTMDYTCWFDQNYDHCLSGNIGSGHLLLDVANLSEGFHTVNVQLGSGRSAALQSYLFYKLPVMDSVTYTKDYTCWFDQDYDHRLSGNIDSGHLLLDVANLSEGFHTVNVQLGSGRSAALQSYLFYKLPVMESVTYTKDYTCWFDQNYDHRLSGNIGSGHLLLDVANLSEGFHTVNVQLGSGRSAALQSYLFYKLPVMDSVTYTKDYTCWFDQNYDHRLSGNIGSGHLLLDVANLSEGFHTVNVQLGSGRSAALQSYLFYKFVELELHTDSSSRYWHYSIDGRDYYPIEITSNNGWIHLDLDVNHLPTGFHTIKHFVMSENGTTSTLQNSFFYKISETYGLNKYEYYLNGNNNNSHSVVFSTTDTFQLISLLPVDTVPIRSTCFEFVPNDGFPIIYAKNDITFRFWTTDDRFSEITKQYVDENVMQVVVADTLERDTTKTIPAPCNNSIHWFKLAAGTGDSLAFHTDKPCVMQLFSPSGEVVFSSNGQNSVTWNGCHAWEEGDYYLAVHEADCNAGNISVSYKWIYRYAVLAWDVHRVGNGGVSTITFEGNGFNSLDTVYLIKGIDSIPALALIRESNTSVAVIFNFEGVDTGMYRAAFFFTDETMPVNHVVYVEPFQDIVLTTTVSYPSTFLRGSTVTYTYTITNTGNMTAYNVPIYIYCETQNIAGISHLELTGLELVSIIDGVNLDNLNSNEKDNLKNWARLMGDDHYFLRIKKATNESGDSVTVRSNYFTITVSPYQTKIIELKLTSNQSTNVWFTSPDSLPPLRVQQSNLSFQSLLFSDEIYKNGSSKSISDWYCCIRERAECMIDRVSYCLERTSLWGTDAAVVLGTAGLISGQLEVMPVAAGILAASQGVGEAGLLLNLVSTNSKIYGNVICGDGSTNMLDALKNSVYGNNKKSVTNSLGNVILEHLDNMTGNTMGTALGEAIHIQETMVAAQQGVTYGMNTYLFGTGNQPMGLAQCMAFKEISPDCILEEPSGGQSYPYVPVDPNDITGYMAESGSLAIGKDVTELYYMIEFENDTAMASGNARTVVVRDTLNGNVFDLKSFNATSVAIGDELLNINGGQSFIRTFDMRPEIDLIAQVQLVYDSVTGVAVWQFSSLDPMTLQPTTSDTLGFLAIGGTGEVNFTINRKNNLPDSTIIDNRAWITFDNEDPISTSIWRNIMDSTPPISSLDSVVYNGETATANVLATDNLSGVWQYNLYAQLDENTLLPVAMNVPVDSSISFVPPVGTLQFRTAAVDSAGNTEAIVLSPPVFYDTIFASTCDSYMWFDSIFTMTGEYVHTKAASVFGACDTVTTLILTINYSTTGDTTAIACDSYDWYEHIGITTSGEYTHTFTNASGCDSVVTLHLTVNHSNTGDTTAIACDSYDWYEHVGITTSGEYTHTFTNASGCDSIVTLHLTVNYSNTGDTTAVACDNFTWYGTTYTQSGSYQSYLTNAAGCDSIVTLHLTVNHSNTGDTTAVACDNFTWYGTTYTQSGSYQSYLTNAAGCDSVVTLHLTVNHSNTGDTTAVACDSFDWYEHVGITTSGEYTHTFTNANGCDSIVTLHLTLNHSNTGDTTAVACDNFTWYGTTYTQSGSYQSYLTNAAGCDSIVTLHLTLAEAPTLQAISGETEICINQFASYYYDISDPDYQYRWFKDNALWAENVPQVTLHEMNEGGVLLTMQVADEQLGCLSDTSLLVQVVNRVAPDTTEIRRKSNTNILLCQPVYSDYGEVHYRWGYTDLGTSAEVVMPGDHNYCMYDFGIDTLLYRYWVETYFNNAIGNGCDNRSYYGHSILTSTFDYDANIVEAYLTDSRIVLHVSVLSPDNISADLYDVNGKLLLTRNYGVTDVVSDNIPVSFAPGVYFLRVRVGNQIYPFKLMKL